MNADHTPNGALLHADSHRRDHGTENLAGVRRLVLSIVHLMDDNLSIRRRFLRAAQVPEYRLELIGNAAKLAEKL